MNYAETRATDIEPTPYERTLSALKPVKTSLLRQVFTSQL